MYHTSKLWHFTVFIYMFLSYKTICFETTMQYKNINKRSIIERPSKTKLNFIFICTLITIIPQFHDFFPTVSPIWSKMIFNDHKKSKKLMHFIFYTFKGTLSKFISKDILKSHFTRLLPRLQQWASLWCVTSQSRIYIHMYIKGNVIYNYVCQDSESFKRSFEM